jgi:hypothetical protein
MKADDLVVGKKYYLKNSKMFFNAKHDDKPFLSGNPLLLQYVESRTPDSGWFKDTPHWIFIILEGELKGQDLGMRVDALTKELIEYDPMKLEKINTIDEL